MNQPTKCALVTGGSGAIGAAICRRLAAAGHRVYVHAHTNREAAEAVARELTGKGLQAEALSFDVTDAAQVRQHLEPLLERAPIQILVNNAGVHEDAAFPAMSAEQWQRVLDVGLGGFFNVTQPLTLPMIRTRWGRIINISSVAALMGNRGQVNYAAAKGALNSATRALALELATRGITVNAVAPGLIDSSMTRDQFDAETIARLIPMKRAGLPEEVAALVAFLASEDAAYITAQIISINGGMT
ncbi:MAG TPA: 3-oxoacyl-ACP reductase FabG [Steroidobacteraceae bacterium]